MKTVKQRKDELMALLEAKKKEPVNVNAQPMMYDEYKKILTTNGIKNEKVIEAHLPRMVKAGIPKTTMYSNLKFMRHLITRLTEEGIPLKDAEVILTHVTFNMHEVNEDDDYIGTFALLFAEVCALRYEALFGKGVSVPQLVGEKGEELVKSFNTMNVELPAP